MNNPPFAIGQKVVRTHDGGKYVVKGNIYTCAFCYQCIGCGDWKMGIAEFPAQDVSQKASCSCGKNNGHKPNYVGRAKFFAPIETNYSDATAEILEKYKSPNETPDKIIVPEKIES